MTSAATKTDDHLGELEQYRRELTGHCYRMLGSAFEAEDAAQEALFRAWRAYDRFEGRSSLRSWLYRIATNVCLDMLNGRQRRARPMDVGAPQVADRATLGPVHGEATWIEPIPDGRALPDAGDPGEVAVARESIRLAFIGALQHLPPRQRAVLILREVLRWKAEEVAQLLDTTVASVNSALQRARATLADAQLTLADVGQPDAAQEELAARYADAFERYDVESLIAMLHAEATMSMPPYELWLQGPDDIAGWLLGQGIGCRGSRLVPVEANGSPAFGQYRPSESGSGHDPWSLMVVETSGGRVTGINSFLDTDSLFPLFGLPAHLD